MNWAYDAAGMTYMLWCALKGAQRGLVFEIARYAPWGAAATVPYAFHRYLAQTMIPVAVGHKIIGPITSAVLFCASYFGTKISVAWIELMLGHSSRPLTKLAGGLLGLVRGICVWIMVTLFLFEVLHLKNTWFTSSFSISFYSHFVKKSLQSYISTLMMQNRFLML